METIYNDTTFWQAVAYAIGGLLGLGAGALTLKYAAKQGKEAIYYIRRYQPQVIAAVDEPTDWLIVQLDKYVPGKADEIMAQSFPALLRVLADVAEKVIGEATAPELNITAGWVSSPVSSTIMPDGTRQETMADMGTVPAIGVGVGVGDAADQQAAG